VSERFVARRRRALDAARVFGCETVLVTGRTNIRYLSGFTGSAGALLIGAQSTVLATDGRYVEQAEKESPSVQVDTTRDYHGRLLEIASSIRVGQRIAAETEHLSWHEIDRLRRFASVDLGVNSVELVGTTGLVEELRIIKDEHEIDCIRRACAITGEALLDAIAAVRAGVSERVLAQVFLDGLMARGADGPSFEPIVAVGANAAQPHHRPGGSTVTRGEVVLFDVGAAVEGYCADLSRTVTLGPPTDEIARIYTVVQEAQAAAIQVVAPGVDVLEVDQAARQVIASAGYGDHFVHGTGHGLGLDIHEPPLIGPSGDGRLKEFSTVTVEPGIYLPGVGGVRIEDTVLVTTQGAETLTTVPRALIEC